VVEVVLLLIYDDRNILQQGRIHYVCSVLSQVTNVVDPSSKVWECCKLPMQSWIV